MFASYVTLNVPLNDLVHVAGVKKPQLPMDTLLPGDGSRLSIVMERWAGIDVVVEAI